MGTGGRIDGLDGLRGVAALAVVAFHAGLAVAAGWFLGVSLFLTLSGFLITRALISERATTGRIDLRAYWGRRVRRLLPASVLVVLVVGVAWPLLGLARAGLAGDLLASTFGVMNWRLVLTGRSYGTFFGDTSPLTHYWSLGVEEQLYLVVAVLVALTASRGLRSTRRILVGLAALAAMGSALRAGGDATRLYYGTDVRAAELLIGAVAGLPWSAVAAARVGRVARVLALPAVAAIAWLWTVADVNDPLLYRGGLVIHAVSVAIVILAVVHGSVVARPLSSGLLRLPGRWSYGIYLIHFPVLLILRDRGVEDPVVLLGATLALTLPVAAASHRWIETPVQQRRVPIRPGVAMAAAVALVAMLAVLAPASPPVDAAAPAAADVLAAAPQTPRLVLDQRRITPGTPAAGVSVPATPSTTTAPGRPTGASTTTSTTTTTTPPPPPVRTILIAGDSMAWLLSRSFDEEGPTGDVVMATVPAIGCGVGRPERRIYLGVRMVPQNCDGWRAELATGVSFVQPERLVMLVGLADLSDARPPGWRTFGHVGMPEFDEWLLGEMRALLAEVAPGVPVLWLTFPPVDPAYLPGRTGRPPFAEADPARLDALNALIGRLAATTPGVTTVPFDEWARALPGGIADPANRTDDGVHLTMPANMALADRLAEQLAAGIGAVPPVPAPAGP